VDDDAWKKIPQPAWDHAAQPSGLQLRSTSLAQHSTEAAQQPEQAAAEEEEWQQYRPEDFGEDLGAAGSLEADADVDAAIQASLADAQPQHWYSRVSVEPEAAVGMFKIASGALTSEAATCSPCLKPDVSSVLKQMVRAVLHCRMLDLGPAVMLCSCCSEGSQQCRGA
jgi:hypothetical protein